MSNLIYRIFRPGQRKVWKRFCEETGSDFSRKERKGIFKSDTIRAYYKNWIIKIDIYKKGKRPTMTRVRAAYLNADSFYFRIYREGLFQGLQKKMGLEDIVIGYPDFDQDFIIQGNDKHKLQQLFSIDNIRQLISWQPDIHLKNEVDESWKIHEDNKGVSVLEFKVVGLISEIERLKDLYELFSELLDQMVEIGSAYPENPLAQN